MSGEVTRQALLDWEPSRGSNGVATERGDLIYEARRTRTKDGQEVFEETGEMDLEAWEHVYRPSSRKSIQTSFIYDEVAYEVVDDAGATTKVYRVTKHPIDDDVEVPKPPKSISPEVEAALEHDGWISGLAVQFEQFDEWDVPPLSSVDLVSAQEFEQATLRREQAIAQRQSRLSTLKAEVEKNLNLVVERELWAVGALVVSGDAQDVRALTLRDDVFIAHFDRENNDNTCSSSASCTFQVNDEWRMGEGRIGRRTNVDSWLGQGWTGERANPSRHSYNDIVVGVVEVGTFEDDALAFQDGSGSTSRIKTRYSCTGTTCSPTSNIVDSGNQGNHGVQVASAIAADYTQNQAWNQSYNDMCFVGTGDHCFDWETAASGMAPEAALQLFGGGSLFPTNTAYTVQLLANFNTDIMNNSWSLSNTPCSITSRTIQENAMESAFDDGQSKSKCNFSPSFDLTSNSKLRQRRGRRFRAARGGKPGELKQ